MEQLKQELVKLKMGLHMLRRCGAPQSAIARQMELIDSTKAEMLKLMEAHNG